MSTRKVPLSPSSSALTKWSMASSMTVSRQLALPLMLNVGEEEVSTGVHQRGPVIKMSANDLRSTM